jgi:hypothetical protein
MGERARAAQAAADEEKKNQAAYSTNTPLPSYNANMQVPQNSWTYDAQGNPVFQVPGFLNSAPAPIQPGSIADYVSKMKARDPNASNPAYDALHQEFNSNKQSTLQSLLSMLSPNYSGGKPMSADPLPMMRNINDRHLARINALAPGEHPGGPANSVGTSYAPPQSNDLQGYLMQLMSGHGQNNLSPYTPWGKGRMS